MRSAMVVSVLVASALAVGCAARPMPATAGPPPAGGRPPPPGYGPQSTTTYNIGGYEVNKKLFWLAMSAATLGAAAFLDNVPGSAKDGQLGAMDFVPVGLYTLGGGFFIGVLK